MLPFLVSKASPQASKLLKVIANLQSTSNVSETLLHFKKLHVFYV